MAPAAQFSPLRSGKENPAINNKRKKHNELSPKWGQEQIPCHLAHRRSPNIGPVEREIEEAHSSEAGANEVHDGIIGSNPAEERHRAQHWEYILWKEFPEEHSKQSAEEHHHLSSRNWGWGLSLLLLGLKQCCLT